MILTLNVRFERRPAHFPEEESSQFAKLLAQPLQNAAPFFYYNYYYY